MNEKSRSICAILSAVPLAVMLGCATQPRGQPVAGATGQPFEPGATGQPFEPQERIPDSPPERLESLPAVDKESQPENVERRFGFKAGREYREYKVREQRQKEQRQKEQRQKEQRQRELERQKELELQQGA